MPRKDIPPEEKVFQLWLSLTAEQRRSLELMMKGCEWDRNQVRKEVTRRRTPRPTQAMPMTGTE